MTIHPLFPRHVLFLDLKKNASGQDILISQNVRDLAVVLIPLPLNFWLLTPAPTTCFAPANFGSTHLIILILYIILAHQGAAICMRYIYILFNECLLCLLSLSISRSHTLMCKGRTSYKIRYLSVSSGSAEHQILNSWVDFPKWVKGLKYCTSYIWLKCFNWNSLHSTYDKIFLDFYINCSLLLEWPARLNPSSWVLNIFNKRQKTSLSSSFDPLTLALSILMLILIWSAFLIKN